QRPDRQLPVSFRPDKHGPSVRRVATAFSDQSGGAGGRWRTGFPGAHQGVATPALRSAPSQTLPWLTKWNYLQRPRPQRSRQHRRHEASVTSLTAAATPGASGAMGAALALSEIATRTRLKIVKASIWRMCLSLDFLLLVGSMLRIQKAKI